MRLRTAQPIMVAPKALDQGLLSVIARRDEQHVQRPHAVRTINEKLVKVRQNSLSVRIADPAFACLDESTRSSSGSAAIGRTSTSRWPRSSCVMAVSSPWRHGIESGDGDQIVVVLLLRGQICESRNNPQRRGGQCLSRTCYPAPGRACLRVGPPHEVASPGRLVQKCSCNILSEALWIWAESALTASSARRLIASS